MAVSAAHDKLTRGNPNEFQRRFDAIGQGDCQQPSASRRVRFLLFTGGIGGGKRPAGGFR
jgi:hypothetical protein